MLHTNAGYMLQLQTMVSNEQLTMTCMENGNFRVFPFTNISRARINDLCNLICLWDKLFQRFFLPQITRKCWIGEDSFISFHFVISLFWIQRNMTLIGQLIWHNLMQEFVELVFVNKGCNKSSCWASWILFMLVENWNCGKNKWFHFFIVLFKNY